MIRYEVGQCIGCLFRFVHTFTHRHLPPVLGEIPVHVAKSCGCTLPEKTSQDP